VDAAVALPVGDATIDGGGSILGIEVGVEGFRVERLSVRVSI